MKQMIILAAISVTVLSACKSDDPCPRANAQDAYTATHAVVERELRSPSTASFPRYGAEGVSSLKIGDCRYKVLSYVDAQNGFGATIRNRYTVEMQVKPGSALWEAFDLVIAE